MGSWGLPLLGLLGLGLDGASGVWSFAAVGLLLRAFWLSGLGFLFESLWGPV